MVDYLHDANAQVEAAQGNKGENAPHGAGRILQPSQAGYDARSTALAKIALNCWFSDCLRLYRKQYSSK
jgi:hypothetical protein